LEDFQQIEDFRQIRGWPAYWRISSRLEDIRQIEGYPADWRSISGRLEDCRQIGAFPADWRISGRLEDSRHIEDFPADRTFAVKVEGNRLPVFPFSGFDLYHRFRNDAFYDLYNRLKVRKRGKQKVGFLGPLPQTL
jgi:hypothetical protein